MTSPLLLKIRSSLSMKIAVVVTLPVFLLSMFFSYHHYEHNKNGLFDSAESQLLRVGEVLKGPAETLIRKKDHDGLDELIAQTAQGSNISLLTVFDQNGKIIACNKEKWIGRFMLDMHPEDMTDNDIRAVRRAMKLGRSVYYDILDKQYCLVIPIQFGQEGMGAMIISLNLESTFAGIKRGAVTSVFIFILVTLVIGVSMNFLFYALFTKRIKSISTSAVKLAAGDMTARAEVTGSDEIGYLGTSFNVLADEITNWRNNLEEMAANRVKELSALYEVVEAISQSLDLHKVLANVLERVLDSLGAGRGAIVLLESDGKTLTMISKKGLSEEGMRQITSHGMGCVGDVILKNASLRVSGGDDESVSPVPGLEQDQIMSALVVPIIARGGTLGALALYSTQKDRFSEQDESLVLTIGSQVGVAVENARLYEKTLELAQLDGLTGLANRRYLMERLRQEIERSERYQTSLSVILLDLDKFKSFNDTYGHLKGDELLKAFSALVKSTVRAADIAGRYGGEEFCVVLPNTSLSGARVIAERIRQSMENVKIAIDENQPPAGRTVSVGIAEYASGSTLEKTLEHADEALYKAKSGGRNRVVG